MVNYAAEGGASTPPRAALCSVDSKFKPATSYRAGTVRRRRWGGARKLLRRYQEASLRPTVSAQAHIENVGLWDFSGRNSEDKIMHNRLNRTALPPAPGPHQRVFRHFWCAMLAGAAPGNKNRRRHIREGTHVPSSVTGQEAGSSSHLQRYGVLWLRADALTALSRRASSGGSAPRAAGGACPLPGVCRRTPC